MKPTPPAFYEKQYFNKYFIALMIGISLFLIAIFISSMLSRKHILNLLPLLIAPIITAFIVNMRLEIKIQDNMLFYKLFPLHMKWRTLDISSLSNVNSIQYMPLRNYGGWGLRYGKDGEVAYIMSGNKGVRVFTSSGKRILFGSQKPDELAHVLENLQKT